MDNFFESEYYQKEVNQYLKEYGEVPPPWVIFTNTHPYSMFWRMGYGEDFLTIYYHWFEENIKTFEEKIAYFKRYSPPPRWLENVVSAVWDIEPWNDENFDYSPYFEKLKSYGFKDVDKFEEDLNNEKWL
ncbi:hypothetical protein IQ215_02625 [Cyanobacterium stanieri LEGE 03274]|uniref:Uncharacterized protein n=1 Tax=Cyanobacterium stanieri LEGE 03274 TaxID=1828756 RepID=A0ABR9V127_9CHRO|nr:hypothetical protein [Cyanobacterium stanieri]MBE9221582.1 hypothetical protein [Cyanobacterium stanieri LEGE 03274]